MKDTKKSAGFTEEERGAMKERAKELKAAGRRGSRAAEADGKARCSRRSPRCRSRTVPWPSGFTPS